MAEVATFYSAGTALKREYGGPAVHSADLGFYAALWLGAYHPEYLAALIHQYAARETRPDGLNWFALFWPAFMAQFPIGMEEAAAGGGE